MKLSYSSISNYMMCPRKFYEVNVTYNWKDASPAMQKGTDVHKLIEQYIKGDTPELKLPAGDKRVADTCYTLRHFYEVGYPKVGVEQAFAVDEEFKPVDYKSPKAILRGKIDVYTYTNDDLNIRDWKTGKKRDNSLQAHIYGLLTAEAMPAKNTFCSFDYLEKGMGNTYQITEKGLNYTKQIVRAVLDAKVFPERRNPLCPWCPVKSCSFWRDGYKKEGEEK